MECPKGAPPIWFTEKHIFKIIMYFFNTYVHQNVPQIMSFLFQIDYERAACNLYIKYGDMHFHASKAEDVLMKQKHRLIWESRHGSLPTTGGF